VSRPPVALVTGNPGKLVEARRLAPFPLESVPIDLPEIQSLDLLEVLRVKGEEAIRRLPGRALIVEEAGLELSALNGFPGPLVKWMLDAIGASGIAKVGADFGDPGVTARCALFYSDRDRRVMVSGAASGTLVLPPRGSHGFGFDPVFLPTGGVRTFGEMDGAAKDELSHRGNAWRALTRELGLAPG